MNFQRLLTLIAKERKQLLRDKSTIFIGLMLPVILLLIFGYGMSLDIRNIKLAIVDPEYSELGTEITARFQASPYFKTLRFRSMTEGGKAVRTHRSDAILYLPQQIQRKLSNGELKILVAVNATNSSQARLSETYIKSILKQVLSARIPSAERQVEIRSRMWFNDANDSRFFMIPGVIVIIMSLIGTKLTSMLMAREYEHGNMESMFVTPMTAAELLIAKAVNNFVIGMIGLAISLIFARFLFHVPLRGSLLILVLGSGVYLLMALAAGLLISSITKNQFIASQISLIASFMPVFMLSGFIFEIRNMPKIVQFITYFVPARYYVDFLQTIFLVGNVWSNILFNIAMMALFTILLMYLAKLKNPKTLEG